MKSDWTSSVLELHGTILSGLQEGSSEFLDDLKSRITERPLTTLATAALLGAFWSQLLAQATFRGVLARGLGAIAASSLLHPKESKELPLQH